MLRVTDPRSDFGVREFPKVRVDNSGGALADKEFSVTFDDKGNEATCGGGFAFAEVGELFLQIFFLRDAEFLDGTGGTIW